MVRPLWPSTQTLICPHSFRGPKDTPLLTLFSSIHHQLAAQALLLNPPPSCVLSGFLHAPPPAPISLPRFCICLPLSRVILSSLFASLCVRARIYVESTGWMLPDSCCVRFSPSFISWVNGYDNWSQLSGKSTQDGDLKKHSQEAVKTPFASGRFPISSVWHGLPIFTFCGWKEKVCWSVCLCWWALGLRGSFFSTLLLAAPRLFCLHLPPAPLSPPCWVPLT